MKMVLSQIASNVALCKVVQLHPLFPILQYYELLHDLFTGDKWVYFYHSVLLTSLFISHCCHKMKCTNCIILILVSMAHFPCVFFRTLASELL